jgi:hypothetical protein
LQVGSIGERLDQGEDIPPQEILETYPMTRLQALARKNGLAGARVKADLIANLLMERQQRIDRGQQTQGFERGEEEEPMGEAPETGKVRIRVPRGYRLADADRGIYNDIYIRPNDSLIQLIERNPRYNDLAKRYFGDENWQSQSKEAIAVFLLESVKDRTIDNREILAIPTDIDRARAGEPTQTGEESRGLKLEEFRRLVYEKTLAMFIARQVERARAERLARQAAGATRVQTAFRGMMGRRRAGEARTAAEDRAIAERLARLNVEVQEFLYGFDELKLYEPNLISITGSGLTNKSIFANKLIISIHDKLQKNNDNINFYLTIFTYDLFQTYINNLYNLTIYRSFEKLKDFYLMKNY